MATSIRTHFVGGNENELVSQKKPPQSVTPARGKTGYLANLWALMKPREIKTRDVEKTRLLEKRSVGSVPRPFPTSWSDVINDPVLWKELREVVLDDAADDAA